MRTKIITGLCALGAALLATAACGSSGTGGTGGTTQTTTASSGGGGAGPACGSYVWSTVNAGCSACMSTSCCDALQACDSGTTCGTLVACYNACATGDTTCVSGCQTAHPDGKAGVDALLACYDASCKGTSACGTAVCDTGVSVPAQVCGECLTMNCCDSWKLCSQDDMCLTCLLTPSAACDGSTLYADALACQSTNCGLSCTDRICDTTLGYPNAPACNHCLGQLDAGGGCCEETQACAADPTCLGCITGKITTGCGDSAAYASFTTCKEKCATECGGV